MKDKIKKALNEFRVDKGKECKERLSEFFNSVHILEDMSSKKSFGYSDSDSEAIISELCGLLLYTDGGEGEFMEQYNKLAELVTSLPDVQRKPIGFRE